MLNRTIPKVVIGGLLVASGIMATSIPASAVTYTNSQFYGWAQCGPEQPYLYSYATYDVEHDIDIGSGDIYEQWSNGSIAATRYLFAGTNGADWAEIYWDGDMITKIYACG